MTVPQRLPDSRVTVEKSAAAKARISPSRASRNRIQTSGMSKRMKPDRLPAAGSSAADITGSAILRDSLRRG